MTEKMSVLSIPLPPAVKADMDAHPDVRWAEVAREAILEKLDALTKESGK